MHPDQAAFYTKIDIYEEALMDIAEGRGLPAEKAIRALRKAGWEMEAVNGKKKV